MLFSTPPALIATPPADALTTLQALASRRAPLALMTSNPCDDRALTTPRAAFDEARGPTRVLGPAAAGLRQGPGALGLITTLGPAAIPLWDTLGDALGRGVDLGLAWDLTPGEALAELITEGACASVGLLLPALDLAGGRTLSAAIRQAAPHTRVLVMTYLGQPGVDVLHALGVPTLDLRMGANLLLKALSFPTPPGRRIALVTDRAPGHPAPELALQAHGLTLAELSDETLDLLASELPGTTLLDTHLQIPAPTERHLAVAHDALAADPGVDLVLLDAGPTRDPLGLTAPDGPLALAGALAPHADRPPPAPALPASPKPADRVLARAHAQLTAALIMRHTELAEPAATALIRLIFPDLPAAPGFAVANLSAAHAAAQRIGWPVSLAQGPRLDDADALTQAWEALLAGLQPPPSSPAGAPPEPAPDALRSSAWDPRWLSAWAPITLEFQAVPFPSVRLVGPDAPPRLIPFPLADHDALFPALNALDHLSAALPEVHAATLRLTPEGALAAAHLHLTPPVAPGESADSRS